MRVAPNRSEHLQSTARTGRGASGFADAAPDPSTRTRRAPSPSFEQPSKRDRSVLIEQPPKHDEDMLIE